MVSLADRLEEAQELQVRDVSAAIRAYKDIISDRSESPSGGGGEDADDAKVQEQAIYILGELYVEQRRADDLSNLFREVRSFFATLPKARTAKIVRSLIDQVAKIPETSELQISLCKECIEWCRVEKRTFLRHRVETRLSLLYLQQNRFQAGLDVLGLLLKEVKKLDDKLLLVEIHLIESKLLFAVKNLPKSKAALTACRTNANAIHCPPLLQAEIDLLAGVLHAEEKDYKTSFSYFYEAFEAFNVSDDPRAIQALKYMMLAKIMCNQPDEVNVLTTARQGVKYRGRDIEALKMVAKCHKQRSLKMFEQTLEQYTKELNGDPVTERHTRDLYETLLEQNLLRILEPFSKVEIDHVAELIHLPLRRVQNKLCEMILDKKLQGTLDQGVGVLILFDRPPIQEMYEDVLATFKNMSQVVDVLYLKAQQAAV